MNEYHSDHLDHVFDKFYDLFFPPRDDVTVKKEPEILRNIRRSAIGSDYSARNVASTDLHQHCADAIGNKVKTFDRKKREDEILDHNPVNITLELPNGLRYIGNVVNGKPHGMGLLTYANGDYYHGQFRNGVRHGEGTEVFSSKKNPDKIITYIGEFNKDERHGRGVLIDENGKKAQCKYSKGVRVDL